MKAKIKILEQINRALLLVFAVYSFQGVFSVAQAQTNSDLTPVKPLFSLANFMVEKPAPIVEAAQVLKCSISARAVGNFSSAQPKNSGLILPVLQSANLPAEKNNFTQNAFQLNPNLNISCATLAIGRVAAQQDLAVKSISDQRTVAVANTFEINLAYHLNDNSQDSAIITNNFVAVRVQTTITKQVSAKKLFLENTAQNNNVGQQMFEILRC